MLKNMQMYKDVKRNELCPCGSGESFKKCCMKEYREAKKISGGSGAKVSCFTPIPHLSEEIRKSFTNFYIELMIFTNQCENDSEIVMIDNTKDDMQHFIASQRDYFYKNRDEIIDKFISKKQRTVDELEILDAIKSAIFDRFFLIARDENSAVIMDEKEKLYNIKALNSPFNELFANQKKYIGLRTALIPYKDSYITDGVYNGFDIPKEMNEYFDNLPYRNPEIIYNKKREITMMPLVINFCISSRSDKFQEMEEIILKKIPENFTDSFVKLFKNEYSYKEQLISAFIRSTDLEKDLNIDDEGKKQYSMIVGGTPMSSYEMNGISDVIPYEIFEKYYQQKSLSKSASNSVYKNIQKNKKNLFGGALDLQSSFYTMLGSMFVDVSEYDDLIEFVKSFEKSEQKKKIIVGIDSLFEELSEEYGFEMDAIFLGIGINLDFINHDITDYRGYMKNREPTLIESKKYATIERKE